VQLLKRNKILKHPFLFIDSGLFVMEVWCEYVFNACYYYILENLSANLYDGLIICKPDIPWVQDGLREYPNESIRLELFEMYKTICIFENIPFTIINGTENRLQQAINFVEQI
ncbi:MAG: AAA family ATPase, partial [Sediminibacterium sp.]|nr:AAA family ATPase [Sediminibacterium sp.]